MLGIMTSSLPCSMTLRGNNRCLVPVSSFITAQRVAEGIGETQGKQKQSLLAPDQEKKPESESDKALW